MKTGAIPNWLCEGPYIPLNLLLLRTLEPSRVMLQQGLLVVGSGERHAAVPVAIPPILQRSSLERLFKGL